MHPDGSKKGEHWMKIGLGFDRVKITNNADDPRDNASFTMIVFNYKISCL